MAKDLKMAVAFHPARFIEEEMRERGWDRDRLAAEMTGSQGDQEWGINRLALDFFLDVGPTAPDLLLGEASADKLGKAFGVNPEYFTNLFDIWRKWAKGREAQ